MWVGRCGTWIFQSNEYKYSGLLPFCWFGFEVMVLGPKSPPRRSSFSPARSSGRSGWSGDALPQALKLAMKVAVRAHSLQVQPSQQASVDIKILDDSYDMLWLYFDPVTLQTHWSSAWFTKILHLYWQSTLNISWQSADGWIIYAAPVQHHVRLCNHWTACAGCHPPQIGYLWVPTNVQPSQKGSPHESETKRKSKTKWVCSVAAQYIGTYLSFFSKETKWMPTIVVLLKCLS